MSLVVARFQIVTPMFLGGANQYAETIRPPSVKGALRFWWRALNWGKFRGSHADDVTALTALHAKEAALFGASAEQGGQGCFLLAVENHDLQFGKPSCAPFSSRSYLLGQGLYGEIGRDNAGRRVNGVTRTAILSGEFSVRLRFRAGTSPDDRQSILQTLRIFGLLGGIGSRSRRGWGSIALLDLDGVQDNESFSPPSTIKEYAALLGEVKPQGEFPPITAISSKIQRLPGVTGDTSMAVVDKIGESLCVFRAFGRKDNRTGEYMSCGRIIETQRFKTSDHDPLRRVANGEQVFQAPRRLIFGMPHNYFFTSFNPNRKVDIQTTVPPLNSRRPGRERRASPLFIHVHPVGNKFCGFQMVLPAPILPHGERLKMTRPRQNEVPEFSCEVDFQPDWNIFKDYFEFVKVEGKRHGNP